MFLIGQIYVVQERALAREERAGQLETLRMPKLRLALLLRRVKGRILLHLDDEADLRAVAEVGHGETAHFLNERFSSQL